MRVLPLELFKLHELIRIYVYIDLCMWVCIYLYDIVLSTGGGCGAAARDARSPFGASQAPRTRMGRYAKCIDIYTYIYMCRYICVRSSPTGGGCGAAARDACAPFGAAQAPRARVGRDAERRRRGRGEGPRRFRRRGVTTTTCTYTNQRTHVGTHTKQTIIGLNTHEKRAMLSDAAGGGAKGHVAFDAEV